MKRVFKSKNHFNFFVINLVMITFFSFILLGSYNGTKNDYPTNLLLIAVLISIPIIYFQYPIVILKRSWIYKAFILYLSMSLFLFVFGMTLSWESYVGGHEIGSWGARTDAGLRMIIFGQLLGGLFVFIPILLVNVLITNFIFKTK